MTPALWALSGKGSGMTTRGDGKGLCINEKASRIREASFWGAMWGSNPRHPEPQSGALPTELIAPYSEGIAKVRKYFFRASVEEGKIIIFVRLLF